MYKYKIKDKNKKTKTNGLTWSAGDLDLPLGGSGGGKSSPDFTFFCVNTIGV